MPDLDADALLAQAQAQTGLADWGDDTLPARFRLAVEFLKSCRMDAAGERAAAQTCLWLLSSRLSFFEDFKRYPIGEEQIVQPLFATGEPRSGTTLLHALLSVDPKARALRFWEVMYPSPPPGTTGADDPRRGRADADWREINTKMAFWLKSHPYNDMLGEGLPEDERTWAFDFRVMTPTAWWRVPFGMNVGGLPAQPAAQYRIHKMMLQQFQYARPKKYWVLKGFHGPRLPEFFATYPDARMIWVHRDPVQAVASRIVLTGELVEGLTGRVDWAEQARVQLAMCRAGFKNTLENPLVRDPRIHHVRYPDFIADPVATIRGFYQTYGIPFAPDTEAAMRDYLNNNRGDRYGKFTYSTAVIGEDIEALHREFAPYRERFGLEIEHRK
ncbi:MAG TPA: sulfotransferase [Steroidobacteraceae bacterium]|nr:sulfotransferase [Steroidobacteraceae bacterium]